MRAAIWAAPLAAITLCIAAVSCLKDVSNYCYVGVDCPDNLGGIGGAGAGGAGAGGSAGAGGAEQCMGQPLAQPGCSVATCACPNSSVTIEPGDEPHCYGLLDTRQWPESDGGQQVEGLTVTADNDIIMTGRYGGTFNIGGSSPAVDAGSANDELWVARIGPDLQPRWHIATSTTSSDASFGPTGKGARAHVTSVFDQQSGSEQIIVFSSVEGSHDLDQMPFVDAPLARNCVLIRLDQDGNVVNTVQLFPGIGKACDANGITATADAIYIAGEFDGHITFLPAPTGMPDGCDALTPAGGDDGFLVKLDTSLNPQWCRRFGGGNNDDAYAVAANADGGAIVVGDFRGSLQVGSRVLSASAQDALILAYDAAGSVKWAASWGDATGGSHEQYASAVVANAAGVFVAGSHYGNIKIGDQLYAGSTDSRDIAVVRISQTGTIEWARVFRGNDDDDVLRMVVDDVSVHLVGTAAGDIDLHQDPVIIQPASGGDDAFLLSLDQQCGHTIGARLFSGNSDQVSSAIGLLADGAIVMGLSYSGASQWAASVPLIHNTSNFDFAVGLFQP